MPLTTEKSVEMYTAAREALMQIVKSPQLTAAERNAAQAQLDVLINDYLEWTTDNIDKRTQAFSEFIDSMKALLARLKKYTAGVNAIKRLGEIVKDAGKVLKDA